MQKYFLFCALLLGPFGAPVAFAQSPIFTSSAVCSFHGSHNTGQGNYNKTESCTIPNSDKLDASYHQGDFNCCGGGATSPTTSANIPAGIEVKVDGGHFWAVSNPRLSGATFSIDTYCGPGGNGEGCNVKVTVIAHYRMPVDPPPAQPAGAPPVQVGDPTPQESGHTTSSRVNKDGFFSTLGPDKTLAFAFGVLFIIILLLVAIFDRNPTPFALLVYRVVLAVAAAGIGAVIPGMIDVNAPPFIRAGGAIALFVIVYWFKPAELVSQDAAKKS